MAHVAYAARPSPSHVACAAPTTALLVAQPPPSSPPMPPVCPDRRGPQQLSNGSPTTATTTNIQEQQQSSSTDSNANADDVFRKLLDIQISNNNKGIVNDETIDAITKKSTASEMNSSSPILIPSPASSPLLSSSHPQRHFSSSSSPKSKPSPVLVKESDAVEQSNDNATNEEELKRKLQQDFKLHNIDNTANIITMTTSLNHIKSVSSPLLTTATTSSSSQGLLVPEASSYFQQHQQQNNYYQHYLNAAVSNSATAAIGNQPMSSSSISSTLPSISPSSTQNLLINGQQQRSLNLPQPQSTSSSPYDEMMNHSNGSNSNHLHSLDSLQPLPPPPPSSSLSLFHSTNVSSNSVNNNIHSNELSSNSFYQPHNMAHYFSLASASTLDNDNTANNDNDIISDLHQNTHKNVALANVLTSSSSSNQDDQDQTQNLISSIQNSHLPLQEQQQPASPLSNDDQNTGGGSVSSQQQQNQQNQGRIKNDLYKTEICRSFAENGGFCKYGTKCQFAHGEEELRPVRRHPRYKTKLCRNFSATGSCPYEQRCRFIHAPPEFANGSGNEATNLDLLHSSPDLSLLPPSATTGTPAGAVGAQLLPTVPPPAVPPSQSNTLSSASLLANNGNMALNLAGELESTNSGGSGSELLMHHHHHLNHLIQQQQQLSLSSSPNANARDPGMLMNGGGIAQSSSLVSNNDSIFGNGPTTANSGHHSSASKANHTGHHVDGELLGNNNDISMSGMAMSMSALLSESGLMGSSSGMTTNNNGNRNALLFGNTTTNANEDNNHDNSTGNGNDANVNGGNVHSEMKVSSSSNDTDGIFTTSSSSTNGTIANAFDNTSFGNVLMIGCSSSNGLVSSQFMDNPNSKSSNGVKLNIVDHHPQGDDDDCDNIDNDHRFGIGELDADGVDVNNILEESNEAKRTNVVSGAGNDDVAKGVGGFNIGNNGMIRGSNKQNQGEVDGIGNELFKQLSFNNGTHSNKVDQQHDDGGVADGKKDGDDSLNKEAIPSIAGSKGNDNDDSLNVLNKQESKPGLSKSRLPVFQKMASDHE